jgi:peptidoglycan LD-endopeptidase LytH
VKLISSFHPVIQLPNKFEVLDLSGAIDIDPSIIYSIGKYNEERPLMYQKHLFLGGDDVRFIHMGIDIGAPVATNVYNFDDGILISQGYLSDSGDYGYSMVFEYVWRQSEPLKGRSYHIEFGEKYWVLYGHLAASSLCLHSVGDRISSGTKIAILGNQYENGGWAPHLHFQLSFTKPKGFDMPGVVSLAERERALDLYPDPRQVLGPLYVT